MHHDDKETSTLKHYAALRVLDNLLLVLSPGAELLLCELLTEKIRTALASCLPAFLIHTWWDKPGGSACRLQIYLMPLPPGCLPLYPSLSTLHYMEDHFLE